MEAPWPDGGAEKGRAKGSFPFDPLRQRPLLERVGRRIEGPITPRAFAVRTSVTLCVIFPPSARPGACDIPVPDESVAHCKMGSSGSSPGGRPEHLRSRWGKLLRTSHCATAAPR